MHRKYNFYLTFFWFGPGTLISALFSVGFIFFVGQRWGTIISLFWVGFMSAYANGMMHYNEYRQEHLAEEDDDEDS